LDTPNQFAELLQAKWSIGLKGSVLIANPVPAEYEMNPAEIEIKILEALDQAKQQGIRGKAVTPFLLQYIANHTEGESLETNIALVKNNAKVATGIAVALYGK
jgi:pseudouridine-5'-phosphate glycosidase